MDNRHNFYKVNNRYNTTNFSASTSHSDVNNSQPAFDHHVKTSSYHDKIDTILKQWCQLQEEKKQRQRQQQQQQPNQQGRQIEEKKQQQPYQYDEFDRIMEEDLENQLKELERQEEEQAKLMEQSIEEQLLEQDNYDEQTDKFKEEYIGQLKQIEEFEQFEEEEEQQQQQQQQQRNNVQYKAFRNRKYEVRQEQQQSNKEQLSHRLEHQYEDKDLYTWKKKHDRSGIIMADNTFPNKTNSRDAVPETIEKTIPTVGFSSKGEEDEILLLNDECDSHRLINIFEIPTYLSSTTNISFKKMIQEKMSHAENSINIQTLEQIAILIHQLNIVDLEKSLWTIYLKSGTGYILKSTESNLKVWPLCVESMIQSTKCVTTISDMNQIEINDNICLKFVTEHLYELNEKQQQIQQQLSQKKKQFYGYNNTIDGILQTFIQQHLQSLRLQYEHKIKLVKMNYQEYVLEQEFLQQSPMEQQIQLTKRLFNRKCDYEKAKQEVLLMKQQIAPNQLPRPLNSIHISLPSEVSSLTDTDLCEQLCERHRQIIQHFKNEMKTICTEVVEAKLRDSEKIFNNELANMWQGQRSLLNNQRLTQTMIDFIDRRLTMITGKMECIYKYKFQQQSLIKAPIIIQ